MGRVIQTKSQLWAKIKADWPDLAEFLKQLKAHGMPAEQVIVHKWPNKSGG